MSSASSTPRDRITLTGLRARGRHGVFDFEKRDGQEFVVDVELRADLSVAGASDDLADTVNYAEVAQAVIARVTGPPYDLIEALAEAIAADCLALPGVARAAVTVHKPAAPIPHTFDDVSVRLVRAREAAFVVALGANLGDRAATLTEAVAAVRGLPGVFVTAVSALVETDPVGGPEQGDYLNAVLVGRTSRRPEDLLAELHRIEARHGRARTVRWGERTLDLDLIQFGTPGTPNEVRSADPALLLPHPRASERGFVLLPWLDADPRARIRVGSRVVPVAAQVTTVDLAGVRPVAVGPPHTDPAKGRA
ncbi:MAG: 2-amino-4-hydroxy-6-hydroxymethyldihydropteridine diphosphokinase [Nostocoides sp.]